MLNDKIKVNQLTLENRIVYPPMATELSDDGIVSDALVEYYAKYAGKVSLIITEHSYVLKEGKASVGQVSSDEHADMAMLKKLTDAIHDKGTTKVFAQINHAGQRAKAEITGEETEPISIYSKKHIEEIKEAFVSAALRMKECGYDGVEIHAAHGYLLNQFYSPLVNTREDAYTSKTMEGRTKLACEIIEAVREAVGAEYPVAIRFGAFDDQEGGSTIEEAAEAAVYFEKAGVDMIDVSGGMSGFARKGNENPGWFADVSAVVKKAVSVPVLVTGGVKTKEDAEKIIGDNAADLVGVGRAMFADPAWCEKALG